MIGEFPKMWMQDTYEGYQGKYWSLPPRKILPKPYEKPHPPMWYAAGNTSSYEMAAPQGPRRARLLASAASTSSSRSLDAYKQDDRRRRADRRLRQRQRDGHRGGVRRRGPRAGGPVDGARPAVSYLQSNVFRYHDTFPRPDWAPAWPELIPDPTAEEIRAQVGAARHDRGRPRRRAAGSASGGTTPAPTSSCFGAGMATQEEALETIRLMGEHVIPKIDTDPVHRTSRFRREAGATA